MRILETLLPTPLIETIAWVLIHFVWQGAMLGSVLLIALWLLVSHSAQLRYSVASFALVLLLAFPLATTVWVLQTQHVNSASTALQVPTPTRAEALGEDASLIKAVMTEEQSLLLIREFSLPSQSYPIRVVSPLGPSRSTLSLQQALLFIVLGWSLGVLLLSLRLLGGWIAVHQLRTRGNRLAPATLQRKLAELSRQLGLRKRVRLLESSLVRVPVVIGWFQPVILLPSKVIKELGLDKLATILAHELVHILRHDWLVIIVQKTAETFFFYHPVVWWLSAQIERERENSCDDLVLAFCGNATLYANALAELEALRLKEPQLALAASSGSLLNRIRRLKVRRSIPVHSHYPMRAIAGSLVMAAFMVFSVIGCYPKIALAQAGYDEAPMLAQRVEAGELPPVHERLPQAPLVVEPHEQIGQYGGTLRTALVGGGDDAWITRTIAYENLVRWNPEWTEIVPNIAKSFEVNDDASEYTFYLREGMRWSDGHPFTADDIVFWYEDVLVNPALWTSIPSWLTADGEPLAVEKVDDYTVRFVFAAPSGFFLQFLASGVGDFPTRYPRHYLEQFHIAYNPEGVEQLARAAGVNTWIDLFEVSSNRFGNSDMPVLWPWKWVTAYGAGASRAFAERNPYYFKVDPEGNQLPYIDNVSFDIFENSEVLLLRILSGEIDLMSRHVTTEPNQAVFVDNMERGNYSFFSTSFAQMNTMIISLNQTHPDPVKWEIFQNRDFRIGLSHAIDRQEIIDLIYLGRGEPWQGAPQRSTPFFNERLAKQYTEHNVELANEHLDRAGYVERDAQGYRLGPNGNRIAFVIEVTTANRAEHIDILELVQLYWREVGIDMQVRSIDRTLLYTRKDANEHDAVVWLGAGGLDALLEPRYFFPFSTESNFAQAWSYWYNNPSSALAEEPSAAARRQMELYDQIKSTGDSDLQIELMKELFEIAADEFYVIGISSLADGYGIVSNRLNNIPAAMPFTPIDFTSDWRCWKESEPLTVLEPELEYEGAKLPLEASVRGGSAKAVRQLRDPGIFEEAGRTYLLYAMAGESGIAIVALTDA